LSVEDAAGISEPIGIEAGTVVGHDASDLDVVPCEVSCLRRHPERSEGPLYLFLLSPLFAYVLLSPLFVLTSCCLRSFVLRLAFLSLLLGLSVGL
jgi:hypothetical protein